MFERFIHFHSSPQKVAKAATFGYVPINVQNANCASRFKTRFSAFFKFTVTNIFPADFFVTITFFPIGRVHSAPFKIWTFIYTKTDIATFSDIKQPRTYISKAKSRHFVFYRHVYRQVINITMPKEHIYVCDKCDYSTSRKFNYLKHNETDKHKSLLLGDVHKNVHFSIPGATGAAPLAPTFHCPNCDRKYMAQRSLWRHSKHCSSENNDNSVYNLFSSKIAELCQSNAELSKANQVQNSQMIQLCTAVLTSIGQNLVVSQPASTATPMPTPTPTPTSNSGSNVITNHNNLMVNGNMVNNSNNKTFNINMFLNEQCKDAMNMTDFVKTIELDTNDMEDVGKRGFVKGISKIFIENLEKTDISKRPIHCSDSKREILYIKDDNKWEREGINSKKLVNAIHKVEHKNVVLVNEWAKMNPQCENSDTQANQIYMTLSKHATDGDEENITKVAKRIAKTVVIDKDDGL